MLEGEVLILSDGTWKSSKDRSELFGTHSMEPLFKTSNNKCKNIWQIGFDVGKSQLTILHGTYETSKGAKGSLKVKRVDIKQKSNRTIQEQCSLESNRRFENKKKLGYRLIGDDSVSTNNYAERIPMLASKFKGSEEFPLSSMPKLDGVRCISYNVEEKGIKGIKGIRMQSRNGKPWTHLHHIEDDLQKIFEELPDIVLDGELYIHGLEFTDLVSIVQKNKNGVHEGLRKLEYHVFDFIDKTLSWNERYKVLNDVIQKLNLKSVKLVEETKVNDISEVETLCKTRVAEGYEGLMLRYYTEKKSLYISGRTTNLLKVKYFFEMEVEIVDVIEGKTATDSAVIFIAKLEKLKDVTFKVVPIGTLARKTRYLLDKDTLIGKTLTIKYQELSQYGIPRFPVGKVVRDYE